MKRPMLLWLFFFALFATVVHAQEISLLETTLSPGETLQAKITADPSSLLLSSQISLLDVQNRKVNIAPLLVKITDEFYTLYFDLPLTLTEGNYTLEVLNAQAKIIIEKNIAPVLAINPGFINVQENQEEFQLEIENKQTTTEVRFATPLSIQHVYTTPQIVQEGTKRTFKFSFDGSRTNETLEIVMNYENASYIIPLLLPPQEELTPPQTITGKLELLTTKKIVNKTIAPAQALSGPLSFKNTGNAPLYNVTVALTGNLEEIVTLDTTMVTLLMPSEEQSIFFWVNKEKQATLATYRGDITLTAGTEISYLPMIITVEETTEEQEDEVISLDEDDDIVIPFIEPKPISETPPKPKKVKVGVLVFIILFVLAVAIFFFMRGRRTIQKRTFDEYMRNRPT